MVPPAIPLQHDEQAEEEFELLDWLLCEYYTYIPNPNSFGFVSTIHDGLFEDQ